MESSRSPLLDTRVCKLRNPESPVQLNAKNQEYYYESHPEHILPLLHYTVDEAGEIQQALTNIPDYVEQAMARFITGDLDIDRDWDSYLSNLENMGLSRWLKVAQQAYERTL
jgi:putative aldouronate transport system substrate-binding protein